MSYLRVRNWERFQHYRDRRPPWVKFYVELLDDSEIRALPLPTRFLLCQLLLLAARHDNAIANDFEAIANDLRMKPEDVREGLAKLLTMRWLQETRTPRRASKPASSVLAKRYTRDRDRDRTPLPQNEENGKPENDPRNPRRKGTNPRALGTNPRAQPRPREDALARARTFIRNVGEHFPPGGLAAELTERFPELDETQIQQLVDAIHAPVADTNT